MANKLELADLCKEIVEKLNYLNSLDPNCAIKVSIYNSKSVKEILDILNKSIIKKEKKLGIYKPEPTNYNF